MSNPHDCPIYNFCSQTLCPFDDELELRVGSKKDKCLDFEQIKEHLTKEQIKKYKELVP